MVLLAIGCRVATKKAPTIIGAFLLLCG